ncbi:MAG TPA: hypothetical protein VHM26_15305 [Chitinophagaceae bacterium]|jgi:hypothetical protein|nr:hypothetical protein [Chitinophagaceae bacterium]
MRIAKNYAVTILRSTAVLLLSCFLFASCSKDKDAQPSQPPPPEDPGEVLTIQGRWNGKYGKGHVNPTSNWSFNIKPGGALELLDANKDVVATGAWQLNGNEFTGNYTFIQPPTNTISLKATLNADFNYLSAGTWGYQGSNSNGGKWWLSKADE